MIKKNINSSKNSTIIKKDISYTAGPKQKVFKKVNKA